MPDRIENGIAYLNGAKIGDVYGDDYINIDNNGGLSFHGNARFLSGVGTSYFLDPTNGSDSNDGKTPAKAFATLPYAYSQLTANKNDVLFYIANNTSITLSAQLDWAKDYTHFVGICAPVGAGKRARIFQLSTATGIDLLKVSGNGCIWKNIYAFHGVADATSKICMTVTGERNYFQNCHFAGIGNVTMSVAGAASLKLTGSENVFNNCQIGLDTISRDADPSEILLDGGASRNVFEDCLIYGYASAAGYASVILADATAIDRYLWFKNCLFLTESTNKTITQTEVFTIPAGIAQGKIILQNCMAVTDGGAATWDSNTRGIIWNNAVAAAASAAGGIGTNQ